MRHNLDPTQTLNHRGARLLVLLAVYLGAIVVLVQLIKFANQPSLPPAAFALILTSGLLTLVDSSKHLFPSHAARISTRDY